MSTLDKALVDIEIVRPPRALGASRGARFLNVEAYVWSRANHTDGAIPRTALRWITDEPDAEAAAAELVSARLWSTTLDGWQIVEFLATQKSAARVAQIRANDSARYDRWQDAQDTKDKRVVKRAATQQRSGSSTARPRSKRVGNDAAALRTAPQGKVSSTSALRGAAKRPGGQASRSAPTRPLTCSVCGKRGDSSLIHNYGQPMCSICGGKHRARLAEQKRAESQARPCRRCGKKDIDKDAAGYCRPPCFKFEPIDFGQPTMPLVDVKPQARRVG